MIAGNVDWSERAACKNAPAHLFFPERGETANPAKAICHSCPVIAECLNYAIANNEGLGIWGGHSERERRPLRAAWVRRRGAA